MAKSALQIEVEAQIKSLLEEAKRHLEVSDDQIDLAREAERQASKLQELLDASVKRRKASKAPGAGEEEGVEYVPCADAIEEDETEDPAE